MTITVTLDELRAYDKALSDWYKSRLMTAEEHVVASQGMHTAERRIRFAKTLDDWTKSNPKPTLIPSN